MYFEIDDTAIVELERKLKRLKSTALPFATLDTLNRAVMGGQKQIQQSLKGRFTIRNKWTVGSIQYRKARGLDIGSQASQIGSAAEYMAEQEEGFTRRGRGRHGFPVPTSVVSGQPGAKPRTRPMRGPMKLVNIHIAKHKHLGKTSKQRNVRAIQEAVKTGKRFVFLETATKKGIYKVMGGSKKTKRGLPKGAGLRMVYSLSRKVITTKKTEWLAPEREKIQAKMPELYRRALTKQLANLRL